MVRVFGRIGLLSFGGPAAQIALMHRELVDERPWLTERQFLDSLGFCMLLPGPEAMQLATFAGWRLRGVIGGLIGGLLFVMPGAIVVTALAIAYHLHGDQPIVQSLFAGIQAAVVVIVIEALIRLSKRALTGPVAYAIAAASFVSIFGLGLPFPLIVLAAGILGAWLGPHVFGAPGKPAPTVMQRPVGWLSTAAIVGRWLAIWIVPLALLDLTGASTLLSELGWFFSKLAVVTFGGAYAVLAYMAQEVVEFRQWLTASEMLDGLGLAETTPGPLILVTTFVGFTAAAKAGGLLSGLAGAAVSLWATFAPCFLWIFAGAPFIDRIASSPRLSAALSAITAAVVGVIANLSVWFAFHVFFTEIIDVPFGWTSVTVPAPSSFDPVSFGLAIIAAALLFALRLNLLVLVPVMALAGWAASAIV